MKKKILYIVNVDYFILSHRLPILCEAIDQGFDVHVACANTGKFKELESHGFNMHRISMDRKSMNPFLLIGNFFEIFFLIKAINPSILHLLTIKPIVLGGLSSLVLKIKKIVVSITGFGFIFASERLLIRIIRVAIKKIYKIVLARENVIIITQNTEDRLNILNITSANSENVHLIKGTGIDMLKVGYKPLPNSYKKIVFMASRLLKDKGVKEFLDASNILFNRSDEIYFYLAGDIDQNNPESFSYEELQDMKTQYSNVNFMGQISNVLDVLNDSYISILPSYREGFPKFLSESASVGRPIITTDVAGCRDAVIHGETGILIPVKNSVDLAKEIEFLVDNDSVARKFSIAARRFAENELDLNGVLEKHITIYKQ